MRLGDHWLTVDNRGNAWSSAHCQEWEIFHIRVLSRESHTVVVALESKIFPGSFVRVSPDGSVVSHSNRVGDNERFRLTFVNENVNRAPYYDVHLQSLSTNGYLARRGKQLVVKPTPEVVILVPPDYYRKGLLGHNDARLTPFPRLPCHVRNPCLNPCYTWIYSM